MDPDDERLARAARTLRRRAGLRQVDVATGGRSRQFVMRLEARRAGELRLTELRRHFAGLGARLKVSVWWNGAALDRLLDERHAGLVEDVILILRARGWQTLSEVTYSEYGERGSIDVLAAHEAARALFVGEIKTAWGSLEETNRHLDTKARLAPRLCFDRFGWRPAAMARVLVMPDDRTLRRIAARHGATLDSVYPGRGRDVRAWVRRPTGTLAGLWFLSEVAASQPRQAGRR